jgi:hypothetical protein
MGEGRVGFKGPRGVTSKTSSHRCAASPLLDRKSGAVVDCDATRRWYIAGVSPKAAKAFINAQVGAEVALAWLRAGFLPTEAIQQIQRGVSLESAKAETAKVSFSKAFRRDGRIYSIRREFKDRVSEAVDVLDVPSSEYSSMFASAETRKAFLVMWHMRATGGDHTVTLSSSATMRFFLSVIASACSPHADSARLLPHALQRTSRLYFRINA